jgi:hypothetical protein
MRIPIVVHVKPFDVQTIQAEIAHIRADFGRYLSEVPRKKESKHGMMGPIGKLLGKVKGGRRDPDELKGYILNVDRAVRSSSKKARKLSAEGIEALERSIDKTCLLLQGVPPTDQDKVIDRIDYGLYFDLRKTETIQKEARRQAYITFLRNKYGNEVNLSDAWGEEVGNFDELYLPRKAEGSKGKKATIKQQDIAAFWESQGAIPTEEEG